ncbi:ciliary microtubule inner protein 6-like [Saccoglossus kowalevskii]|uniref:Uncharacterized protein LOC100373620 n=1 Tax=Saccoglossus kowalevskii TaxID=10224 RepID=A0ABM0GQS2_SACKO|nr:PREDICTED: uncharacterized protein LOC100373620 [Saccoglossus kowalevskii]
MTLYMPPLSRKGRTDSRYDPDTRRVFNTDDTDTDVTGQTHYQNSLQGRQRKQQIVRPSSGTRKNNPHPRDVGFLRQDVALLNDPICHVQTRETDHEQPEWWPSRTSNEPLKKPPYTYDSTMRCDFKNKVDANNPGLTRHGCNPNIHAASGIVPINHLYPRRGPRLLVEHISYEHQYDSRGQTNNPVRGKYNKPYPGILLSASGFDNTNTSECLMQRVQNAAARIVLKNIRPA